MKVNNTFYRDVILYKKLLSAIGYFAVDCYMVLTPFNRSVHHACVTIQLFRRETSDFIAPHLWPPNSPDINPVD